MATNECEESSEDSSECNSPCESRAASSPFASSSTDSDIVYIEEIVDENGEKETVLVLEAGPELLRHRPIPNSHQVRAV